MGILYLLFHVYIDQSQLSLPFLSPFCLEYNDSLFLYFLYNIIDYNFKKNSC